MQPEDLLLFAADAARLMLESGGETYRAEETAMNIITSQGGVEAECFATSTGLMLSFTGEDGKVHAVVRRVKRREMNLEKASRIHTMVNGLQTDRIDILEATRELDVIERLRERPFAVRMGASAVGAAFFTLLYGGKSADAVAAAAIGATLYLLIRGFQRLKLPEFLTSLAGGGYAAIASLGIQALIAPINPDMTIIGVIMLLVPGVAITNAIRDIIAGDLVAGIARGVDAFITAAAISAGAGGAFAMWKLLELGGIR
ncbi:MAG TPA: threonine/serine exporter family protein [Rectinemataceae bacterium]|nr:threonine/serine exporter family protein [Rectinemataceae bacterium]